MEDERITPSKKGGRAPNRVHHDKKHSRSNTDVNEVETPNPMDSVHGLRRSQSDNCMSANEVGARPGLASFDSGRMIRVQMSETERKTSKGVHLSYVVDDSGGIHDIYGFEVHGKERETITRIIGEASVGKEICGTETPPATRRHILGKEASRQKQESIWKYISELVPNWDKYWFEPHVGLERWHKMYFSNRQPEIQKGNNYLLEMSYPEETGDLNDVVVVETLLGINPDTSIFQSPSFFSKKKKFARQVTTAIRSAGVPPRIRSRVWSVCCGALRKQQNAGPENSYLRILEKAKANPSTWAHVIERDLYRTFPTNYHFKDEEGITRMRNVLLAYSMRNKAVGYCQSMNFLVAVLLLHMEEKSAFWVLSSIVEDLVPGHYTQIMTGMHVDQKVFETLVEQRLPKVHAHMQSLGFPLESVAFQWFLCIFVNTFPLETTLRIWDCFLHEGCKALFRIGLAILTILSKKIIAAEGFMELHQIMTDLDISTDKLFKYAYDPFLFGSFPSSKVATLRSQHLQSVLDHEKGQVDWSAAPPSGSAAAESPLPGSRKKSVILAKDMLRRPSKSFKYTLRPGSRKFGSLESIPPVENLSECRDRCSSAGPTEFASRASDFALLPDDQSRPSADSSSGVNDIPQEYSSLYNALAYVITAKPMAESEIKNSGTFLSDANTCDTDSQVFRSANSLEHVSSKDLELT